jgi:hypothetical protein
MNTRPAETAAQHRDDRNSLRLIINNLVLKNGQARRAKEQRVQHNANPRGSSPPRDRQ